MGDEYIVPSEWQLAPQSNKDTAPSLSAQTIISKVYENLWVLWIAVAFALLIRKIMMYQSFAHFVKAGRTEVSNIKMLNMLADVGETIGITKPVELYIPPCFLAYAAGIFSPLHHTSQRRV